MTLAHARLPGYRGNDDLIVGPFSGSLHVKRMRTQINIGTPANFATGGMRTTIRKEDPTIAELLKPVGYMTGQFGKNHLGDKDEFLPTNHGFDEFFGNLYHLNAEEEPENADYPKSPEFRKKFGPRGVIRSFANGRIEDTGPLDQKRMETIDEEVLAVTKDFLQRAKSSGKPFFCWFNTTRMHNFTHVKKEHLGKPNLVSMPTAWWSTTRWLVTC
jgi:arylsulfatase